MKQLTIGVLINQLDGGYQRLLWPGMIEQAKSQGVNLVFYAGRILQLEWDNSYQHEAIYHLVNEKRVDGLIILSAALSMVNEEYFLELFRKKFKKFPVVTISQRVDDCAMVGLDNQSGVIEAVEHLANVHNRKRIAFVKGPEGFYDGEERFDAYKQGLKNCNLEFDPDIVVNGDFTQPSGEAAVTTLLDRDVEIDSICFANDEMAIGALRKLQELKIDIPNDISLVGFDNIVECQLVSPPLATVSQPTFVTGAKSVEKAIALIRGQELDNSKIATHFLQRQSCGCLSRSAENIISNYNQDDDADANNFDLTLTNFTRESRNSFIESGKKIIENPSDSSWYINYSKALEKELNFLTISVRDIETLHQHITHLRNLVEEKNIPNLELTQIIERNFTMLRTLIGEASTIKQNIESFEYARDLFFLRATISALNSARNFESFKSILTQQLPLLEVQEVYICNYEKPYIHKKGEPWNLPKNTELVYGYKRGKELDLSGKQNMFNSYELLPNWVFPKGELYSLVIKPIFFNELHFGFVVFHLQRSSSDSKYESIRELISNNMWRVKLDVDLQKTKRQHEETIDRLNRIAVTDELTGLKNRRGFMTYAELHHTYCTRMGNGFAFVYADLDGLKSINDTYGHDAGDIAIRATAKLLKDTYRDIDIIGRQGGDEFTLLLLDVYSEQDMEATIRRLKENIRTFNAESDLEFKLSLSLGYSFFDPIENSVSLDELMIEADKHLYVNKRKRKARRRQDPPALDKSPDT